MDMLKQTQLPEPSAHEQDGLLEAFMWMMPHMSMEAADQFRPDTTEPSSDSGLFAFDPMFGGIDASLMPNPMELWQSFFGSDQFSGGNMQFPGMPPLPRPMLYPNARRIGTLTVEERHLKVSKFLEKRKRRNFSKKVSYDCRKRVADNRLRVKGRFITKSQALNLKEQDTLKVEEGLVKTEQC
jgi:hypothetical protein